MFTELNRPAIYGHKDVDIFESNSSYQDRTFAKQLVTIALHYVNKTTTSKVLRDSQLAALSEVYSGCAFLRVEFIEHAGLGHTLSCWGKYLLDAVRNKLTYRSPFFSAAHDQCDLNSSARFFGIHPAFYWSEMPSANAQIVTVGSSSRPCTSQLLEDTVSAYRSKAGGRFSCDNGNIVFLCRNEQDQFGNRESKSVIHWIDPVRGVFFAAQQLSRGRYRHERVARDTLADPFSITIVAHVRRGDILSSARVDREHRLMSFNSYKKIIRELLQVHKATAGHNRSIRIYLLCEGAVDTFHIAEYDQSITERGFPPNAKRKIYQLDIRAALRDVCTESINCTATVLHDAPFLSSFTTLCEADVLVTSTSGFSWPPAALCQPPLTIGVPFSLSWQGVARVVPIQLQGGALWREDAVLSLPGITDAWVNMLGILVSRNRTQ